jgi:hypothetical protein
MFFHRTVENTQKELAMLLSKLHDEMADRDITPERFAFLVSQYNELYKNREIDAKVNALRHVSAETWATIGANLAGILLIVGHERAHVLTSQALKMIKTPR